MNSIKIDSPSVENNRITYHYTVIGEWKEVFCLNESFYIEYSCDVSNVPESVAIVPLLTNVLPIAWIYNAEIIVTACDQDFYDSIEDFKQGYRDMYPMIPFGGKMTVRLLQKNTLPYQEGSAAFFSGGVDAFNTLVNHAEEKPTLITLWGADVKLEDKAGWEKIISHLQQTTKEFGVEAITARSSFRRFLDERKLGMKVAQSGDGWWHGFQHGIGIIGHAAPIMYILCRKKIYIASSFTAEDKGRVTCASDPTIDNKIRFCGVQVIHDGYEFNRQMKIHKITQFSKTNRKSIPLRVCWESTGGSNCCDCEKCWRTMLGIYAEGFDPHEFGFIYTKEQLAKIARKMRYSEDKMFGALRYAPIQNAMKEHTKKKEIPFSIRWFYDADINSLGKVPKWLKDIRKIKRGVKKIKGMIIR